MIGRRGRWHKQLLVNRKETWGYWKLKNEALDHTVENSLWKRLWTCRKTDCGMDGWSFLTRNCAPKSGRYRTCISRDDAAHSVLLGSALYKTLYMLHYSFFKSVMTSIQRVTLSNSTRYFLRHTFRHKATYRLTNKSMWPFHEHPTPTRRTLSSVNPIHKQWFYDISLIWDPQINTYFQFKSKFSLTQATSSSKPIAVSSATSQVPSLRHHLEWAQRLGICAQAAVPQRYLTDLVALLQTSLFSVFLIFRWLNLPKFLCIISITIWTISNFNAFPIPTYCLCTK